MVDVTNGDMGVIGNGVLWSDVIEGDWLYVDGVVGIIDTVESGFDELTLKEPWAGLTQADAPYVILKMSWLRYDPALTQAKLRELLAQLEDTGSFVFTDNGPPDAELGEDGQFALKVNATPWRAWLKSGGVWSEVSVPASGPSTFALSIGISGKPSAGEIIEAHLFVDPITFPAGLASSRAKSRVAATASSVFSIQKNGGQVGTVTFGIDSSTGTFAFASQVDMVAGDQMDIVCPNPADATLSGIKITIRGTI
jgi:hypothetical protein